MAKELFADNVKQNKLREPFYTFRNELLVLLTVVTIFFRSMYNKIVIRFTVFGISRIIKDSVRVISLNLYPASTGFSLSWLLAFMAQSIPSMLPPAVFVILSGRDLEIRVGCSNQLSYETTEL